MNDQKKPRPPQFDDIIALSHQPPPKKQAVSPFTLAYDAEERRKQEASRTGLERVIETDFPVIPAPPPVYL